MVQETPRGVDFLREQRKKFGGSGGQRSGFKFQFNSDGDRVLFYFLTDGSETHVSLAHLVETKTRFGMRKFERLCGRETDQDPVEACPRCADPADTSGNPFVRAVYFIYVEAIFHSVQVDRQGTAHPEWEAANLAGSGGTVLYKEEVNEVRLLSNWKLDPHIEEAYAGDPTEETSPDRVPTLLNRKYQWVTNGVQQKRVDMLIAGTETAEQPDVVREHRATTPPLAEVMVKEWGDDKSGKFNPQPAAAPTAATAPGAAEGAPAASPPADTAEPIQAVDF